MNPKELVKALEEIQRICRSNECCNMCVFFNPSFNSECGLAIIPVHWKLNEPTDWKVFKE